MIIVEEIECSQFANTYGGLSLLISDDGKFYLEMQDCFGPTYFGPLEEDEVAAFYKLCDVKEADNA